MPRRPNVRKIAEYLLEDIPSGSESICSDEDDEEDTENQPNSLVLGDLIEEVRVTDYDDFDSDDAGILISQSYTVDSNRPTKRARK